MKKTGLFLILSCFLVLMSSKNTFCNSYVKTGSHEFSDTTTMKVKGDHNFINWTGYKIGGQHTGKISVSTGELIFIDGAFKGGSFEIDMNSITNTDITDEGTNAKLVGHLKSPDFFGVEKHPTGKFVIDKVIAYGPSGENQKKYKVAGSLTIKGITKPIKFVTTYYDYETSISISARIDFDRSDFDIRYGSGTFFDDIGDKVIYDNVLLDVSLAILK